MKRVVIILVLTFTYSIAFAKDSPYPENAISMVFSEYHAGKPTAAKSKMEAIYLESKDRLGSTERRVLLSNLLDICIAIFDLACMQEYVPHLVDARNLEAPTSDIADQAKTNQVSYYIGQQVKMAGNEVIINQWLHDYYVGAPEVTFEPVLYIQRQILAGEMYLTLGDIISANDSIDKALSMIVALNNPSKNNWNIAVWLSQIIGLMVLADDPEQAAAVYYTAGDYIARNLPAKGPEAFLFAIWESEVLERFADFAGAGRALEVAIKNLNQLDFTPPLKNYFLSAVQTATAMNCLFLGDSKCFSHAVDSNPIRSQITHQIGVGRLSSKEQLAYLSVQALAPLIGGPGLSSKEEQLMNREINYILDDALRDTYEVYRIGSLTATKLVRSEPITRESAIKFAEMFIEQQEITYRKRVDAFPLPGAFEKMFAALAIGALRASGEFDDAKMELAFKLFEIIKRQIRQADAESVSALSVTRSKDARRDMHAWMRLNAQQKKQFVARLHLQIQKIEQDSANRKTDGNGPETVSPNAYDLQVRKYFAQFSSHRDQYGERANVKNLLTSTKNLPSPNEIQDALHKGEAFISPLIVGDHVQLFCITKNDAAILSSTHDPQKTLLDYRLINAALTASHAPSAALDTQFPAASAFRLYETFFKPLEPCIKDSSHIVWAPDNSMASLPLGVLLENMPSRIEVGFDLVNADWLIKKYSFSNVLSARGFVAARALKAQAISASGLLGIGNPVLQETTEDGFDRQEIVLRSVADNAMSTLQSLPELPDTEDELKAIAQSVDGYSDILLRANASEAKFRRRPLGKYKYISFATHGLIREEIEGLKESALVLTPVSAGDPLDDGLLNASEIADLHLNAKFVALSACNTANYDYQWFGDEVTGLTAAFAIAGVPAVLVTLWPVDSFVSKVIVAGTFEHIEKSLHQSPSEALAEAQRAFLEELPSIAYAHPRFWAPFVVNGDGGLDSQNSREIEMPYSASDELSTESEGGGKITGVTIDPANDGYYIRGMANIGGDRFSGFLSRRGPSNQWKLAMPELGQGSESGLILLEDTILIDGFFGGGDSPAVSALVSVGTDGKEQWRKSFPEKGYDTYPAGIASLNPQEAVIAVMAIPREISSHNSGHLSLYRLNSVGEVQAHTSVEIPWLLHHTPFQDITLANGLITVAISAVVSKEKWSFSPGIHDEVKPCIYSPESRLITLDPASLQVIKSVNTPLFEFRSVAASKDNQIYAAGALLNSCGVGNKLAVANVTDMVLSGDSSKMDILYIEDSVSDSTARTLLFEGEQLVVFGESGRVTGVEPPEMQDYSIEGYKEFVDSLSVYKLQINNYLISDGLIIRLDTKGELIERRWVEAGTSLYINDAGILNGTAIIGGELGSEAALAKIKIASE